MYKALFYISIAGTIMALYHNQEVCLIGTPLNQIIKLKTIVIQGHISYFYFSYEELYLHHMIKVNIRAQLLKLYFPDEPRTVTTHSTQQLELLNTANHLLSIFSTPVFSFYYAIALCVTSACQLYLCTTKSAIKIRYRRSYFRTYPIYHLKISYLRENKLC